MFKTTTPPAAPADDDDDDVEREDPESTALPLEARVEQGPAGPVGSRGWVIRVPVRAERVTVRKRAIVNEEVDVDHGVLDAVRHDAGLHGEVTDASDSPASRDSSRV